MKVVVDMNLSPRWVKHLIHAEIPAVHWTDVGVPTATDEEIMSYARLHSAVVLTYDLDFTAILAATAAKSPSVIQIRAGNVNPDAIAKQVVVAIRQLAVELAEGALVSIDPGRVRVKLLPFGRAT